MLKYIFATILIAVAWATWFVLQPRVPLWAPILFTILVVGVLVALFLYRRYKARKAAREIERALNAQAEEHARSVRPEQQAEVRAMQAEVQRAISSLKSSKLGKSGAEALYALPWYVIIGPPGAGKSTALRNSGLQFPYLNPQGGGGVRGVGGTRNCEWWLTNEAVLLDTAGRYATEDDDRDEWLAFLDLLKRNRPSKPLNGLMVAVNVAEIAQAREDEVESIAKRLRERVDEVMGHLQMVLPVYLLFTKCDLIQGFVEYFGDLRKNERGQIWGFTVPLGTPLGAPGALFSERFDEMSTIVEQRALKRVAAERRLETREQVYQFPQQFTSLKQNLTDFCDTLFAGNVYQGTPMLRGVYFTSGTQEGRPIDRLTASMQKAFGQQFSAVAPPPPPATTEAKSYFLRDVFARVMFPDQDLAARSVEEIRRQRLQRYAIAAGALATALLISVLPTYAYLENRDLVHTTDAMAALIARHGVSPGTTPLTLADLEPLRQRVQLLQDNNEHGAPLYQRFGMYKGDDLYPQARGLYTTALRRHVIDPLARRDLADMRDFAARYPGATLPPGDQHAAFYNVLKLHLLLTAPRAQGEPALDSSLQQWMTAALVQEWSSRIPDPEHTDTHAMEQNMAYYTQLLAGDGTLALARSTPTVSSVREVLNRTSATERILNDIISAVDPMHFEIDLPRAIGRTPTYIHHVRPASDSSPNRVRGAFTRRGWDEYVREHLRSAPTAIVQESWVLGTNPNINSAQRMAQTLQEVRCQYFSRYVSEWKTFMESLRVRSPADAREALQMLQWFTSGGTTPYEQLMIAVADNTRLSEPDAAAANAAGNSFLQSAQHLANQRLQGSRTGQALGAAGSAALNAAHSDTAPVDTCVDRLDLQNYEEFRGLAEFGVPPTPPAPAAAQPGQPPPAPPPPSGPTALHEYQEQLAFVRDGLQGYLDNPNAPATTLLTTMQTARTHVQALTNAALVGSRPVLNELLPPPIEFSIGRTLSEMAGGASDRWCSAVVVPFARTLQDRYPYNPSGQDAALADIADFYRPTRGALWTYYTDSLASDVIRTGDQFSFSTRVGTSGSSMFRPELVTFLNHSNDISTVMFPSGSNDPRVDFEVRIRPSPQIAELTFGVDGQEFQYRNGPEEWHPVHWPAAGGNHGAKIRARGLVGNLTSNLDETIQQDGEWGLFRLFEAGTVRGSPEARIFSVVWRLRDQDLEIGVDVRPARSENPFFGIPRRDNSATARLLLPFRQDQVAAPHPIANSGHPCNLAGVPNAPQAPASDGHHHHHHHHRDAQAG